METTNVCEEAETATAGEEVGTVNACVGVGKVIVGAEGVSADAAAARHAEEKENDEDGRQAGSGLSPVVVPQPCVSESRSGRGNGAAARRVYFRAS